MIAIVMKMLGNKYVLGAIGVLLILAGIWYYGHTQYKRGQDDCKMAYTVAIQDQKDKAQAEIVKIETKYQKLRHALPASSDAVCGPAVNASLSGLHDLHPGQ